GTNVAFSYSDSFYNDNGANPPAAYSPPTPTNAYLTQITYPVLGSRTFGYYFSTGKQAVQRDPNGADYFNHFLDSLDRLTNSYLPLTGGNRGWSLNQYPSQTQVDVYTSITSSTASPSCTSCRHDQLSLDAFGRVTTAKLLSDPEGVSQIAK